MKVETYQYKNGFRIIYEKSKNHLPLTSIYCFVKCGSIYEHSGSEGIAHFIEHMCFKGTRQLSNTKDIVKTYDSIGAYFNAFTTKEYTFYVIKCNQDYVAKCIHVLSDMLMNSVFKKKDCELEKQVVTEEMIRQEDSPEFHISKMKDKYLYSGSLFERPIDDLLYHKNRRSLDYGTTLEMYDMFYKPNNMSLSVVSNLPLFVIKKIVSSSFFMKPAKPFIVNPSYQLDVQSKIEYNIQVKQGIKATHLSISFRTCSYKNNDKYIIGLLSHIIGGSMTSRMFSLLREKTGLTYAASCSYTYYAHMGEITLHTMTDYNKMIKNDDKPGVLQLVISILNTLIKKGITQEELNAAKGFLQGKMTIKMENSDSQCEYNGLEHVIYSEHESTDDFVPFDQIYKKYYEPITKKQVNDIIRKYFKSESMVVCLLGEHVPTLNIVKECCKRFIG
jgi:predicted Zn-dependent peptidase